jgi:hypothetical protein
METLDWTKLNGDVAAKKDKIPYDKTAQTAFHKVAFDVFQYSNSTVNSLWTLESDPDGKQYLVAQYADSDDQSLESKSNWSAVSDEKKANITLFYKDAPIQRFASTDYNFTPEDVYVFQKTLVKKLSSDPSFVKKLVNSQSEDKRTLLLGQFPELA